MFILVQMDELGTIFQIAIFLNVPGLAHEEYIYTVQDTFWNANWNYYFISKILNELLFRKSVIFKETALNKSATNESLWEKK